MPRGQLGAPHPTGYGDCVAQEGETPGIAQEDETRVVRSRRWSIPDPVQLVLVFVVGVCLTLTVAAFVFYFADLEVRDDSNPADSDLVSVPNVLGQRTYDAQIKLRTAGLRPRNDFSARPQRNVSFFDTTVKLQRPVPGAQVEPGSTVQLQVE